MIRDYIKFLAFNSLPECQSLLTLFESRWHYSLPVHLRDGRFYAPIIDSALPKLTEAERAQIVELTESDLPEPPPLP
jgi:hypothetical protein